jgi:transcriptional regulator with XRE-family HTH domain
VIAREFPPRLLLALKALSLSRGRLAAELAVDKSVISRWLSGGQVPSGHNLANLTALVASRRPGFTLLDWESDLDALSAKLGVGASAEPASSPWGVLGGWLPDAVLREAHAMTALRGDAYEGFWRSTRPSIGLPGRFIHERLMLRKADNGFLTFRLWLEDMRFDGWTFLTQTQLFSVGADPATGMIVFSIYNAVTRERAEVLEGLAMAIPRVGGGSPVAAAVLLERCGDLSGDREADDAAYEELAKADTLAPEGSIPAEIRDHLLHDVGPSAMAAGGPALLMMSFANSLSRGPHRAPPTSTG